MPESNSMDSILEMLSRLNNAGFEYVVVGGVAATFHGSPYSTVDLDVCCRMTEENMARLLTVIAPLKPVSRADSRHLPIPEDPKWLAKANTVIMATDLCLIDLLPNVAGVGDFESAKQKSVLADFAGLKVPILNLDAVIASKTAASRVKDKLVVPHLIRIREAIEKRGQQKE
jgi:hypothetical protein